MPKPTLTRIETVRGEINVLEESTAVAEAWEAKIKHESPLSLVQFHTRYGDPIWVVTGHVLTIEPIRQQAD